MQYVFDKVQPVSNLKKLHALTPSAHSYVLLPRTNVFYTSQILRHGWWAYPSTILCYWCPCAGISIPDFVLYCFSGSPLANHAGSSTCTQRTGRRFVCRRDQEKWSPSLQSCVTARTGSQGVDTQVGSLHSNHDKLWKGPGNRRELIKLLHSLHLVV